jgi:5-methylcytosine-specific restriction protein B
MKCWWVNQGDGYREERQLACLWSPMLGGDGRTIPHWEAMKEIQKGDIIFHYCKGSIKAYSYALAEAEIKEKPNTKGHSHGFQSTEGYYVKVKITDLYPEIAVEDIPEEYKATELGIFAKTKFPKQGYLFPVEEHLKKFLMSQISVQPSLDFHQYKTEIDIVFSWEDLLRETGQNPEFLTLLDRTIKRKKQIVLTGCPGSGKTYLADKFAQYLTRETDGLIEIVQFHPAYTYEDFIQGLRPDTDENNNLIYRVIPGRFLEFCNQARQRKGNCVLEDV